MYFPREIQLAIKNRPSRNVHKHVKQLVEIIGTGTTPVWVNVRPKITAIVNDCFKNVQNHIEKYMGGMQHGWAIWQVANLFVEGEFHAVWVTPQGQYIDITPKPDNETRILFLPDNNRKWDERLVDNIRLPMIDDPDICNYFEAVSERIAYKEANWTPDKEPTREHIEQMKVFLRNEYVLLCEMAMKHIPPANAPCPCDSGRYFCNCCGRL